MSASFNHKLWRSTTGLDDAGMDLRGAQFSAHTSQELDSAATPTGLEQQLPVVALCAVAGVLFAFLILIWLRQQMSREKDAEEGDRRGLVEDGRVCPPDDSGENSQKKVLTEVKWVVQPAPETSLAAPTKPVNTLESLETKTIAASENFSTLFERVKVKTERQWVPESVPRLPTTCLESTSSETAIGTASPTTSIVTTATTATASTAAAAAAAAADAIAPTITVAGTSSLTSTMTTAFKLSMASSSSSMLTSTIRKTKHSPRRDGSARRTLSMYSPHVSALVTPERKPDQQRRAKNLLERRGSSASLTIELGPATDSPSNITPTHEFSAEEYLLSTSNVLSRAQLRKAVGDSNILHKEFWEVPQNFPDAIDVCGSGTKNRYCSVLPNPRSRVVLPGSDDPLTSYINANYVRGYDDDNRYIATQGPLSHTIQDFWSMAWAERTPVIVMMTRLHEGDKTKCEAYFPLEINSRLQAGPFTIILNSMDIRGGYTVRDLEVRHENERRTIQHFWYDAWPDHFIPPSADALVGLAAEINALSGPIIVHCSAGIGRTGCFIAIASGMKQLTREGNVDILGIVCQMRYDRGGMVQTAEQYEFIYKALCLFEETLEQKSSKDSEEKGKLK